jgi:hypothetical protein
MLSAAIPAGKNIWVQLRRAQSLEQLMAHGLLFCGVPGGALPVLLLLHKSQCWVTLVEWYLMVWIQVLPKGQGS